MRKIARYLAESPLCRRARELHSCNLQDWNYPLSRGQKLQVGVYMILKDFSEGIFPPRFDDEQSTFAAENAFYDTLQTLGKTEEELFVGALQKPFWHGSSLDLKNYAEMQAFFHRCGVNPPMRLLEAGCGSGWMAEFLAASGFRVTATTLDPAAGKMIDLRRDSLIAKGVPHDLQFRAAAMEYVQDAVADLGPFDAVYVHEALHHAHDWKKALRAFYETLLPGGWCFILNEPNVLHTFVSYRVARLSNTHEIGMGAGALKRELKAAGFTVVRTLKNRAHFGVRPSWVAAQK